MLTVQGTKGRSDGNEGKQRRGEEGGGRKRRE